MDIEAVQDFVDQSETILDSSPQMDEANTKAAILRNFLELLGWDIPMNTQLEFSIDAFRQTYKVDYALVLDAAPVAFMEAKGADTTLTESHENQIDSYMTNANVNYGILTNGKEYRFFQRRVNSSDVSVSRVGKTQLEELPKKLPVLRAFTKEAIESGDSKDYLEKINKLREARYTLETEKDEISVSINELLTDWVSEAISSMAEPQAKEMIDRLIEDIDNEIDSGREGEHRPDDEVKTDVPARENKIAGKITRSEIAGDENAKVAVFPVKKSGLTFLKENNAWGYVRVGSRFDYVAMYVTREEKQVKYFAKVEDVVDPHEADLQRDPLEYVDRSSIAEDKMVVTFEPGSLYELEDPIPYESKYPQSLRYTTLGKLKQAETTDDLFDSSSTPEPTVDEEIVMKAVKENPGSSLRAIHRAVGQNEGTAIGWIDEWGDERENVQSALQNLRSQEKVRLENRSWYPTDEIEN
ncbi:type I restriction enzyme HsdR N-terminal domain-containing protein [Halodesulfurarchaeum sp. HSR-GB]|uniref:type I restriction enzyme HsdR N-terminal domain-containing protein n=1 Tax=Halodesulfurarchaeum sp. HSR-GB TaxID=3074077 RepID=UPI002856E653|nr:type I restriction enzyme HsdR N-terminal domain-containing protein [Halodesulfurarchaeum sp. HSR-GB]MDR5657746.1 type I restriction enzyme HsdR N-terminal domain-containing protein [Halodesulfurarchaeum sp. HSR-GB]